MNKIIKISALFICLFSIHTGIFAQTKGAVIEFKNKTHNFGDIQEKGGKVTTTFQFTNTGSAPLVISNVSASCGCTTPDWSKAPVAPGKTGFVKATYDPINRPYPFDKTITVSTNGSPSQVVLHIKGNVIAKPMTIEEQYPVAVGNIRLKNNEINFARSIINATQTETLEVYNTGNTPAIISFEKVPSHIRISAEPVSIGAKQKGTIKCTYLNAVKNEFGPVSDIITVKSGNAKTNLEIKAYIEDDFSKLSKAELDNAPVAAIKNPALNFGTIKQNGKANATLTVINTGKSNLEIRKVAADGPNIEISIPNKTIKPGQSVDIALTINGNDEKGNKFYTISVVTNSPSNQSIYAYITGDIN